MGREGSHDDKFAYRGRRSTSRFTKSRLSVASIRRVLPLNIHLLQHGLHPCRDLLPPPEGLLLRGRQQQQQQQQQSAPESESGRAVSWPAAVRQRSSSQRPPLTLSELRNIYGYLVCFPRTPIHLNNSHPTPILRTKTRTRTNIDLLSRTSTMVLGRMPEGMDRS
jgi:hypothetical protein